MSDERGEAESEQGGVFGNLPASRPGTRSPRRDQATKAEARAKPKPKPARAKAAKPRPAARPAGSRPTEPVEPERPPAEEGGGLDDLAWAGVAAVAEAATLGVRLANRALGALRDSVDRR
jgi:hypothetical protein